MAKGARESKMDDHEPADEFVDDNFEDEVEDGPPSINPYEVLGLEREATGDEVKKAYRKMALKHHPDKAADTDKTAANKRFQEIAFAYAVLSDEHRRKRYDLTGSTAEVLDGDDDFDWLSFYREQWDDLITTENITRISDEYKGSEEERNDIIDAYEKCRGDLNKMYQFIMLSDLLEDDDRFRQIIDEEIQNENIDAYPAYKRENTDAKREKAKAAERKRREDFTKHHGEDAAEKAKAKQKKGKGSKSSKSAAAGGPEGLGDLAALIRQRQKSRAGGFFDHLEAKYAPSPRASKKRATPMEDEPTEEEFLAASKKLKSRSTGRAAKSVIEDDEGMEMDEGEGEDLGDEDSEDSEADTQPTKKKTNRTSSSRKQPSRSRRKAKA